MANPHLSIIIPAYNEEERLPNTLKQVDAFLSQQAYPYEVLIIENGSSDRTLQIAQEFAQEHPYLKAIHSDERGKGVAVKKGMLAASGEYRFICDADLSMPIGEVNRFIPPLLDNVDVAIASREAPGAIRYDEPANRHITGRLFNMLARYTMLPGLQDTQCGFKCFSKAAAEAVFPLQTIHGWTFDVEVLVIARRKGFKIVEVPIPWYYRANSKVRMLHDLKQVVTDLFSIWHNSRRGVYGAPVRSR